MRASQAHQMPQAARPQMHAGGEADAGVEHGHLGRGQREGVGGSGAVCVAAAPVEIGERGSAVEVREDEADDRVRKMIEEHAVEVAHRGFGGRGHGFLKADGENYHREGEVSECPLGHRAVRFAKSCHRIQFYLLGGRAAVESGALIGGAEGLANRHSGWFQTGKGRRW
jgi:hypothetical protein